MDCRLNPPEFACSQYYVFAFFAYVPLMVKSEPLQANPIQQDSIVKHLIKGKILNKKKGPLPGVTVRLDSTLIGTSSDNNGNYRIFLPLNKGRLVFSFIGYKTKTLPFSKADTLLNVILEEDVSELDEVQVIAYGEQSRRNRVGSMSVVKADEIKDLPSPSINNLLQGRAAGVDVTNMTGAPVVAVPHRYPGI
ncbi:MAG: carboxypeptidase-like regulatory domain-containing protein [Butyricimonas paravirosa]